MSKQLTIYLQGWGKDLTPLSKSELTYAKGLIAMFFTLGNSV